MINVSGSEPQQAVLPYVSPAQSGIHPNAQMVLVVWKITCILATPLGILVGIAGSLAAWHGGGGPGELWNTSSAEDWIGLLIWLINAAGFVVIPPSWAYLCSKYRKRLRAGDITGSILAERLCRFAMLAASIAALGILFGLTKACIIIDGLKRSGGLGYLGPCSFMQF